MIGGTQEERLTQFRSRWRRWLGQKRRGDLPFWTDLLASGLSGWPRQVLGEDFESETDPWAAAINRATDAQLQRLDILNLQSKQRH